MQVVMNSKCFLLYPEKALVQIRLVIRFRKKRKKIFTPMRSIPKNDVTDPKASLL